MIFKKQVDCQMKLKGLILYGIISCTAMGLQSQSFFSITPDFGGDGMAGMALNIIPLEEDIKVVGLVPDSLVPGFEGGTWPIFGAVSYTGDYSQTQYLVDSLYTGPYSSSTTKIAFKNDSICYLYVLRDLGNIFLDAYLVELNFQRGVINRSRIIYNQIANNGNFTPRAVAVDEDGNVFLVNIDTELDSFPQFLTVLDSSFTQISQTTVSNGGRKSTPLHAEVDEVGNITLIGMSQGEPTSYWWESKLYRQVLNSDHTTVDFKLAPTMYDQSVVLGDQYPLIKGQNDCWIIVDGDQTSSVPVYWAGSITEVVDGYVFSGTMHGGIGRTSGIIGKVGLDGDSLWLKHFIPLGWDSTRALWLDLRDIKTTPPGNIVACGRGFDLYNEIRVPWILHLDSDGCLDPGCQPTASVDIQSTNADLRIFPNPARTECHIHVQIQRDVSDARLRIIDSGGALIRELGVVGRDVYFLIDLEGWPQGVYYAQLVSHVDVTISKQFVVMK